MKNTTIAPRFQVDIHIALDSPSRSAATLEIVGGGQIEKKQQVGCPTTCGAPITKASSCLPINAIATH
jgi:hypothetical protein